MWVLGLFPQKFSFGTQLSPTCLRSDKKISLLTSRYKKEINYQQHFASAFAWQCVQLLLPDDKKTPKVIYLEKMLLMQRGVIFFGGGTPRKG